MDGEAIRKLSVAVLVPCLDEEAAIAAVVGSFRAVLPEATIHVYDNASTDRTSEVARAAGAVVRSETRRGKGNVVSRMFADVDADVYVLVDGDGTYEAASAPAMVNLLLEQGLDLVTGTRHSSSEQAYRAGHRLGNRMLGGLVALIFGRQCSDVLSGYRVMSRRFVKSFPALSEGFEIETELTVHALELRMPMGEQPTPYGARPSGGSSKLRTLTDGWRILRTIIGLAREERPLEFFFFFAVLFLFLGLSAGVPVVLEFVSTGQVPRFPTAILSSALMILASLSGVCGLVLDTVTRGRRELRRLHYLAIPAPLSRRRTQRQ